MSGGFEVMGASFRCSQAMFPCFLDHSERFAFELLDWRYIMD